MKKIEKEKIIEYFEDIPYYRLEEEMDEIFPKNNPYKKRIRELEFKISDLEDEVFYLTFHTKYITRLLDKPRLN